jgi:hypothetical protein
MCTNVMIEWLGKNYKQIIKISLSKGFFFKKKLNNLVSRKINYFKHAKLWIIFILDIQFFLAIPFTFTEYSGSEHFPRWKGFFLSLSFCKYFVNTVHNKTAHGSGSGSR